MKYREFFANRTFELLQIGTSNWDYYKMGEMVVALAKPDSGCDDCFFGDMKYFERLRPTIS